MNVFVLGTGRCGTTAFAKACSHIENYSCGHESKWTSIYPDRLDYSDKHIEVDNRLSFYLGLLDEVYGDGAYYVHLLRDIDAVISSFARRECKGVMQAWMHVAGYESLYRYTKDNGVDPSRFIKDYVVTTRTNIEYFLKDKTHKKRISIEDPKTDFILFCHDIGAIVDNGNSLAEFDELHNHTIECGA